MIKIRNLISILMVITTISIVACQNRESAQVVVEPTITMIQPAFTATPVSDEKEAILQEIKQLVANYNALVETEKQTGTYETITISEKPEGFLFTDQSLLKVYNAEMPVQIEITSLNEKYYTLAMRENRTLPPLNPLAQNGEYDKLLKEYLAWLEQETIHGSAVRLYSTGEGQYYSILVGESYVTQKLWEQELTIARAKLNNLSDEAIKADILEIQRVENSSGQVTFLDIGSIPYYSLDKKLSDYETKSNTYVLYSQTHQIIEIAPKQSPLGSEGSAQELEQKAREIIAQIAPDVNFDALILTKSQKMGAYFFHWEDRSKFLDDGHSYPSVQIGLNGKGELLSYYNTLPLAK